MVVGLAYMNKTHVLVIAFANLTNKTITLSFCCQDEDTNNNDERVQHVTYLICIGCVIY